MWTVKTEEYARRGLGSLHEKWSHVCTREHKTLGDIAESIHTGLEKIVWVKKEQGKKSIMDYYSRSGTSARFLRCFRDFMRSSTREITWSDGDAENPACGTAHGVFDLEEVDDEWLLE